MELKNGVGKGDRGGYHVFRAHLALEVATAAYESSDRELDSPRRRRLMAFRWRQADELTMITTLVTRTLLLGSVRQTRLVWGGNRSHAFLDQVVARWDEEE